jgi:hypothetical protein
MAKNLTRAKGKRAMLMKFVVFQGGVRGQDRVLMVVAKGRWRSRRAR